MPCVLRSNIETAFQSIFVQFYEDKVTTQCPGINVQSNMFNRNIFYLDFEYTLLYILVEHLMTLVLI
jgi:hypothetical protein